MDHRCLQHCAGQFLVLRLHPKTGGPSVLRNYSMSGKPGASAYRVSVKEEPHGIGSTFLHHGVALGDTVEVSAPRGSFLLRPGTGPVVLVSAGVGATPVLAMLHEIALAYQQASSRREVWWFYGARNGAEHPFAKESREVLRLVPGSRSYVAYSRPGIDDRLGVDYDVQGHLDVAVMATLGVPREADFYLCGPVAFMRDISAGLKRWNVSSAQIHSEAFGPEEAIRPGILNAQSERCAPALGTGWIWATGFVYAKQPFSTLASAVPEPLGVCRGMRCPSQVGLPKWRLPYLRIRVDRRDR